MRLIKKKITSRVDFDEKGKIVSYVNVYNYYLLRKKKELFNTIDYFTFDGFLFQYLFFFLTGKLHKRLAPDFGSYFSEMFSNMDKKNESIYFIGAKDKELLGFVKLVEEKYPNIIVKGMQNGYFNVSDERGIIDDIKELEPDKVIVGLGTPKQEEFALKIKSDCSQSLIFNCGAFISQTANNGVEYYPKYINRLNLRWMYRIHKEKGLLKRYMIDYPKGVFYIIKDRFLS
ncbi:WecB/TagA/CpsF family glycosyltransferase [Aquimarina aggregata]|uniref:WecB/TagA/CpsF family glycosyltransferase n=1 Tax=Aquimarina aggregata TaxID=1642818 RepID=UPI00249176DF|nr:WecB/TagA/CpsF family glycosyltransferase [Aquimarina aggregata]